MAISQIPTFTKSEAETLFSARAKYVPDESGGWRLANICSMPKPVFHYGDYERADDWGVNYAPADQWRYTPEALEEEYRRRSVRRAKEAAFDLVLCNQFDWFCTLTFSAEYIDRSDYEQAYGKIKNFFSNLVQRHGFAYLAVPEYHKKGNAIHFHLLANGNGLKLERSGHYSHGKPVYNINNWCWGFSTALHIDGENCRDKCAKYIFKYMGKQVGQKIGGRYFLSGGDLERPRFVYGNSPEELGDLSQATYQRDTETIIGVFRSFSFI